MTALDFTNELAPLIWTMEGLMLVAVVWLVVMFFTEQVRPTNFRSAFEHDPPSGGPDLTDGAIPHDDRRMAA
jgi:hypothetical protein